MTLRKRAHDTMDDLSEASAKVIESTEWATVALIAVAAVSVFALAVGLIALGRTGHHGTPITRTS